MTTFEQRLKRYKKEECWFVVDVYKDGKTTPCEIVHDLTWHEVNGILKNIKKDKRVSSATVLVEDWDAEPEDGNLFKCVCDVIKKPVRWSMNNKEHTMVPIAWE